MRKLASAFENLTRILFGLALVIIVGFAAVAAWAWIFGCGGCAL